MKSEEPTCFPEDVQQKEDMYEQTIFFSSGDLGFTSSSGLFVSTTKNLQVVRPINAWDDAWTSRCGVQRGNDLEKISSDIKLFADDFAYLAFQSWVDFHVEFKAC